MFGFWIWTDSESKLTVNLTHKQEICLVNYLFDVAVHLAYSSNKSYNITYSTLDVDINPFFFV